MIKLIGAQNGVYEGKEWARLFASYPSPTGLGVIVQTLKVNVKDFPTWEQETRSLLNEDVQIFFDRFGRVVGYNLA